MEPQREKRKDLDEVGFLHQCIKKILRMKRAWDILFRIIPPPGPDSPYSVILEKGPLSEQVTLSNRDVARSLQSATDIYLSTEIRLALQRLEKRARRKSARS